VILDMFQNRDVAAEILNAVNIFRIDAISQDSGMTIVNGSGTVTTARNTALEYRYSGIWSRCWMEKGPNSDTIVANLLASLCPQADQTIIVLNTTGQGGCARGNSLAVTRSASWAVAAHELGHMFGEQGDEYQCNQGSHGLRALWWRRAGQVESDDRYESKHGRMVAMDSAVATGADDLSEHRREFRRRGHFPRSYHRFRAMVDRHLSPILARSNE
jgi:hypothetical protein